MQPLLEEEYGFAASETESLPGMLDGAAVEETPMRNVLSWPLDDYERSRSSGRATIAMLILFAAGALTVWYLSRDVGVTAVDPADQAIEAQVNAFLQYCGSKSSAGDTAQVDIADQLVRVFNEYCLNIALPKGRINDNPFLMRYTATVEVNPVQGDLTPKLEALALSSIMHTKQGATAIVNNEFVRVGDQVGEFRVAAIGENSITLSSSGLQFLLAIRTGAVK